MRSLVRYRLQLVQFQSEVDPLVRSRLLQDERGAEAIEFVGLLPLVLLMALFAWQMILVGYAGIVAAGAAREGARAAAVDRSVNAAVQAGSAGLRAEVVSTSGGEMRTVRVRVQVPKVALPFVRNIEYPWVYASATMRWEGVYHR